MEMRENGKTLEEWLSRLTRAGYDIEEQAGGWTSRGSWNSNHPMVSIQITLKPTAHEEWDKKNKRTFREITLKAYACNASSWRVYATGFEGKKVKDREIEFDELPVMY